jgi:hypothetical protein
MTTRKLGLAGRIAHYFINSKLTPLLMVFSLLLGAFAVMKTPREEEPQIIVPMMDVFVEMPGATAQEVEQRVTTPMEKLLWEIPGVEYVYSTTRPGMCMAIVRFKVGENEEESIVKIYNKLYSNFDLIPPGASKPLIKPRSIDDVPVLALTFWSDRYDSYTLRRIAEEVDREVNGASSEFFWIPRKWRGTTSRRPRSTRLWITPTSSSKWEALRRRTANLQCRPATSSRPLRTWEPLLSEFPRAVLFICETSRRSAMVRQSHPTTYSSGWDMDPAKSSAALWVNIPR